eukprot:5482223-Karenia_brevis.AAC.1
MVARSFPGLVQPDDEVDRWVKALQETSIRYHNPQNRNVLKPPVRTPGQSIQYKQWDHKSSLNSIVPAEFLAVGEIRNRPPM